MILSIIKCCNLESMVVSFEQAKVKFSSAKYYEVSSIRNRQGRMTTLETTSTKVLPLRLLKEFLRLTAYCNCLYNNQTARFLSDSKTRKQQSVFQKFWSRGMISQAASWWQFPDLTESHSRQHSNSPRAPEGQVAWWPSAKGHNSTESLQPPIFSPVWYSN